MSDARKPTHTEVDLLPKDDWLRIWAESNMDEIRGEAARVRSSEHVLIVKDGRFVKVPNPLPKE